MSEPANLFDQEDEELEEQALAEAEAELAAGKGVPHDRVRSWLKSLAAGRYEPPPGA
ncbi:hypothetical protein [Azospirillum sp. sgz302134]